MAFSFELGLAISAGRYAAILDGPKQHHVKVLYCAGASKIFCPYCGVDI